MSDHVVLVDESNVEVGTEEKMMAHVVPRLHRAFSIFVCNQRGQLLMQLRADGKYHSGGLWSNACCGHPRSGEDICVAAHRRLREEMGFDCELFGAGTLIYRLDVGSAMSEHELNHVFIGMFEGDPSPDPVEVSEWRWFSRDDVLSGPLKLTAWFSPVLTHLANAPIVRAPDSSTSKGLSVALQSWNQWSDRR